MLIDNIFCNYPAKPEGANHRTRKQTDGNGVGVDGLCADWHGRSIDPSGDAIDYG